MDFRKMIRFPEQGIDNGDDTKQHTLTEYKTTTIDMEDEEISKVNGYWECTGKDNSTTIKTPVNVIPCDPSNVCDDRICRGDTAVYYSPITQTVDEMQDVCGDIQMTTSATILTEEEANVILAQLIYYQDTYFPTLPLEESQCRQFLSNVSRSVYEAAVENFGYGGKYDLLNPILFLYIICVGDQHQSIMGEYMFILQCLFNTNAGVIQKLKREFDQLDDEEEVEMNTNIPSAKLGGYDLQFDRQSKSEDDNPSCDEFDNICDGCHSPKISCLCDESISDIPEYEERERDITDDKMNTYQISDNELGDENEQPINPFTKTSEEKEIEQTHPGVETLREHEQELSRSHEMER